MLKRLLVGRPLSSSEQDHQRLPKKIALATFSSDPISSTAYATEEILFVTAVGASSLALGLSKLVPMSMAVALLLAIVVVSYRQTIFAYPNGGGAYIVSRENLGQYPSLIAGASLLIDYILTVAVSVSAGVAAIISLPAFRHLASDRVLIGLGFITLLTVGNLRGLKESGRIFAIPTYVYIVSLAALVGYGLLRVYFGHIDPVPFDAADAEGFVRPADRSRCSSYCVASPPAPWPYRASRPSRTESRPSANRSPRTRRRRSRPWRAYSAASSSACRCSPAIWRPTRATTRR